MPNGNWPVRLLVLGGTMEARVLAAALDPGPHHVVSSLAGRVSTPRLPAGIVRIGGFGGVVGLTRYLAVEAVEAVVDATHPFAGTISQHAETACRQSATPLLVLRRAPWQRRPGDRWHRVPTLDDAREALDGLRIPEARVLLTTGRRHLAPFRDDTEHSYLIRAVEQPEVDLPPRHQVILDRGPYTEQSERTLMLAHGIDVLITKDSGGDFTYGKLAAARGLGLEVIMVDRPAPGDSQTAHTVDQVLEWISEVAAALSAERSR
jgi:precorrin-6A/cobalt-precorrin-6A reductase